MSKIGIIGVGVMGEALLAGVLTAGVAPSEIAFVEKRDERANEISKKYEVSRLELEDLATTSDVLLLVVKPQDLGDLLHSLAPLLKPDVLLISFAAGKRTSFIESIVGAQVSTIRVMPNTPTLIGEGMAAVSAGSKATREQLDFVVSVLSASGEVVEVDEAAQDAVTAVSGSGPAYFFAFVEAMVAGGIELGLDPEIAMKLTIQTMVGSAGMLIQSGKSPTTLRENVTSPNGTTAAALKIFSDSGLTQLVAQAMKAASDRSQELA